MAELPFLLMVSALVLLGPAARAAAPRETAAHGRPDAHPVQATERARDAGDAGTRCLAMLPDDPDGAADLAADWAKHGGGSAAAECGALAEMATGDPAEAARTLDALAADAKQAAARRAILAGEAAQAWLSAGEAAKALDADDRAAALSPNDPGILGQVGRAALEAGKLDRADAALSAALRLDPRQVDALVTRAEVLRRLGRAADARAEVDAANALAPGRADILLERGVLREAAGDREGARADWSQVVASAPDTEEADQAQQDLALLEAGPETR
ncbi:MAG: hypothetical protein INR65_07515 [Gluconacetobacter diazotrophicus]|nr:hypothetical protein [Gluconacetobacter diazotrophicus]